MLGLFCCDCEDFELYLYVNVSVGVIYVRYAAIDQLYSFEEIDA